jgi:glutamate dehydrogenase
VGAPIGGGIQAAKADLLARAVAADPGWDGEDANRVAYVQGYYRNVAPEDLLGRAPADLLGAALSLRDLALVRPQGRAKVRVFTPSAAKEGWTSPGTVVEVVTDDMPFLVDSIAAELTRAGRGITLVVHPTWRVARDVAGRLKTVSDASPDPSADPSADRSTGPSAQRAAHHGSLDESWIHVEIDREGGEAEQARLTENLLRVLRDVREAVEDWQKMLEAAGRIADELAATPPRGVPADEVAEARELLHWLADGHFTFLGYREDRLSGDGDRKAFDAVLGTGLGLLRADQAVPAGFGVTPPEARPTVPAPKLLMVTKADTRSTVHRPAYLDYIGIKSFDEQGNIVGERGFLGLFSRAAYAESIRQIPVLRRKASDVLRQSGLAPMGHSGKDLMEILETYPRDELFQVSVDDLVPVVWSVLHLQERRRLRLFVRRDDYGRFVSCLVYLPRDRYTTTIRLRMERILRTAFRGSSVDYTARISESVLARLHFVVRTDLAHGIPDVDPTEIEAQLVEAARSWVDDMGEALRAELGAESAARLLTAYPDAFPEAYKEDFPARAAVADLVRTVGLDDRTGLALSLYEPFGAGLGERRFKIYRAGPLSLSGVLPVLENLGVEVLDERPYEIERADGKLTYLYDFGLRHDPDLARADDDLMRRFQDAFAASWSGAAESDGFNALVLRGGLDWRQVMLLRAYARYLRQAGFTFSQGYVERCLVGNVGVVELLVRLFEARFDPDRAGRATVAGPDVAELTAEIETAIDKVQSLDADRILRSFRAVIGATTRTNYFQRQPDGGTKDHLSLKLDPRLLPGLPKPTPWSEIWVYSPRMEGAHLRFGAVARGGLRWSDRPEDFRTEVLGLVKAQAVKNAVIVPVGAKGGFVAKHLPDPAVDAKGWSAEGITCYQTLIRGMLDLTDNIVKGRVEPPPNVVRHDGDDPYLVVAADKGTATFSDIANALAADYGYWLGDAFASGGSAGYDHKAMGITARGVWESVTRHFRELGLDTRRDDFSVVGVGDMSGDVFGNGMLLSEHIRLVAAFDHRHVFLDPDPDPRASYDERRRLFDLPHSSWADYDSTKISAGGGVYPRSAKSIPLSPHVREILRLPAFESVVTPARLMTAILTAPVDLFWNGGIGTYVKASWERHADVGDKANDAIRVDGADLRCRVIGEGGNLGLTQLGRIETARAGIHVNTDAIDNSAGVDCSDHEVNIKILLDGAVLDGDLTGEQRGALLADMTDEIARLVLKDNYDQNLVLGVAREQAHVTLNTQQRFIRDLEQRGGLDRSREFLPSDAEIERRRADGAGLTSPEYAVLLAYSKISLTRRLLDSGLPDSPWFGHALRGYFPAELATRFEHRLDGHPLRREIVATSVANDLVNHAGTSCVFRAREETGASESQIVAAYTVAREVFGLDRYWRRICALDNVVPTNVQAQLWIMGRQLVDQGIRWLLQNRRLPIDVAAELESFGTDVERLVGLVPDLLHGAESQRLRARAKDLEQDGVPSDLALQAAGFLNSFSLLDVSETARRTGQSTHDVAQLHFSLSGLFDVDRMLGWIAALPTGDRWQSLARSALRFDLYAALAALTTDVLATTPSAPVASRIGAWESANGESLARARGTFEEIVNGETFDLATLSVALRTLRTLIGT